MYNLSKKEFHIYVHILQKMCSKTTNLLLALHELEDGMFG
jgi:hypothetical protein